jgi:hypothetical protein
LIVKLRYQFIKSLFECFHIRILLRFYIRQNALEKRYLLNAFSKVVFVFFLDFKLELSHHIVELTKEINLISVVLEVLVSIVKAVVLLNEILNSGYILLKVSNTSLKPFLGLISPLSNNPRH